MSEEKKEDGMSTIKKTVIGILTTILTAAGAYVTTHIEQLFGVEEEPTQIEQVESAPVKQEQSNEQNVNVQGPTINVTIPTPQPAQTRVIERVIEKPVPTKPVKEVEDEDPW